jgi:hypothetical protein
MHLSRGPKAEASAGDLLHLFTGVAELPAVVIGGAHDRIISRRRLEAIHEQLPQSSICFLPACGHLSHEESPAELLMLLETLTDEALGARRNAQSNRRNREVRAPPPHRPQNNKGPLLAPSGTVRQPILDPLYYDRAP